MRPASIFDVIAIAKDLPRYGIREGAEGTVVDVPAPGVYTTEFVDESGYTYALVDVTPEEFSVIYHHTPAGHMPVERLYETSASTC